MSELKFCEKCAKYLAERICGIPSGHLPVCKCRDCIGLRMEAETLLREIAWTFSEIHDEKGGKA